MIISDTNYLERVFGGLPTGFKPITFPLYQDTATKLFYTQVSCSSVAGHQNNAEKEIGLTLLGSNWMISVCVP